MEYRNFGSSDLRVSAIGYGCWEMGSQHYGGTDDARRARGRAPMSPGEVGSLLSVQLAVRRVRRVTGTSAGA